MEENLPMVMFVSTMPSLIWIMKSRIVRMFMPSDRDQLGFGRVMGCVIACVVPITNHRIRLLNNFLGYARKWPLKGLARTGKRDRICWAPSYATASPSPKLSLRPSCRCKFAHPREIPVECTYPKL